jgi:hypothetical protein
MHTVEMLEQALDLVTQLGYQVRQESLAGCGSGASEVKGRKVFFLDLDLGPDEQLEQVLDTLRQEPEAAKLPMSSAMHDLLKPEPSP